MTYFFITGSSKGLGKSLTELLLANEKNVIYGFARTTSIEHKNYSHTSIDLNDSEAVADYNFPELQNTDKIVLINNAGTLGDVKHMGNLNPSEIVKAYNINLIAPAILTNSFIKAYKNNNAEKLIINVSSGAGRSAIDGWSIYCSSKAGLDMLSSVVSEESRIDANTFKILSIAPGIIDTNMQAEIRKSEEKEFSAINKFLSFKKDGDLASPKKAANQLIQLIENPQLASNVLCSVRDL